MFRPAASSVRQQAQSNLKTILLTQQKRAFGANHPPAVHPYFGEQSPLYTPYAYTKTTPNSTYGDKFPHPMNYQGEVTVTPKSFTIDDLEHGIPVHVPDARVPNTPLLYILGAFLVLPFIGILSAQFTADLLLSSKPIQAQQLPWYFKPNTSTLLLRDIVLLQGHENTKYLNRLNGVKNVYQTDEFQQKLQEYLASRSKV